MGWTYYQYALWATESVTRVAFRSTTTEISATGPTLDDVVLNTFLRPNIPISAVPDTGSLMLAFLGVMATLIFWKTQG